MLKGRNRDPRAVAAPHLTVRPPQPQPGRPSQSPTHLTIRTPVLPRAPIAKPEPDYEVVEFPTEQYVNAKLQPPPPPPPRPPTGHPAEAASCGLCGGGGARVRCTECGRRALCASCDDMYHRHPKRRHHQRQALSLNQVREERPPLPPKGTPPVPPPRRHKISGDRMSASPRPPSVDQRNSTLASFPVAHTQTMPNNRMAPQNAQQIPAHLQGKLNAPSSGGRLGSMPYLPTAAHPTAPIAPQNNTLGHHSPWQRPRGSLPGFNVPANMPMPAESWETPEAMVTQSWGRPLRRGASVLELGGHMGAGMGGMGMGGMAGMGGACGGCGQCAGGWRYGSCASLDHQAWGAPAWPQAPCCHPQMHAHAHPAPHMHAPYTPQPYRRADSRAVSRVASRAGSRAASPAMSVRSRASRRTKHRTPSPQPPPSSDADSESEDEPPPPPKPPQRAPSLPPATAPSPVGERVETPRTSWQCEHCTFVNEPHVRVCAVCCRTPTAAPRELPHSNHEADESPSVAESARSIAESARGIERLEITEDQPLRQERTQDRVQPERPQPEHRPQQNGETTRTTSKKERISTGCGPSPPREDNSRKLNNRLVTPSREPSVESTRTSHDMAVGPSPPREVQTRASVARSPPRQNASVASSPYREIKPETPTRHSISVGPSPPRENSRPSPIRGQKKSTGTSPPREREKIIESRSSTLVRANVSNTGTSPPPQSISTQTYEVPHAWERAPSAARVESQARSRARRRFRDDARRSRSHSRHSLSSDTRESERTSGGGGGSSGRWEWRETRDSSPAAEWSGSERRPRLARRASHLDLRRAPPPRRASLYRAEAASPEPSRAMSLEALGGDMSAATRGLELARLMSEAERLGFSAAEVQAALAQSPAAPLWWLRERWPSLCAGVIAAAARLAPHAPVSERDARAALARHRGAMWPAVTDCVQRHRPQKEASVVVGGAERRHGGRVWGSPAGADDDAAPPRLRAEDSSDEFDGPPHVHDDWAHRTKPDPLDEWDAPPPDYAYREVAGDVALELSRLLVQAGVSATPDDLILNGLLSTPVTLPEARIDKPNPLDLAQSENDFIDAYNALTRSTPLPSVDKPDARAQPQGYHKRDKYDVTENVNNENVTNATAINHNQVIAPEIIMDLTNFNEIVAQDVQIPAISNKNILQVQEPTVSNPSKPNQSQVTQNITQDEKLRATNNKHIVQQEEPTISNPNKHSNIVQNIIEDEQIDNDKHILQQEATISKTNTQNKTVQNIPRKQTSGPQMNEKLPEEEQYLLNVSDHNIPNENFEETIPNLSAVPAAVKQNVILKEENSSESEQEQPQGQEKANNLNDIVGNTQRLIQQMKDEINSDINYIDSRTTSQSEADTSSNESDISSEHESSYSDTEDKDSDEVSSNESETSGTESETEHMHERRPTIIHRTSSEENDQFEEAMDHIEDQMEDFKHTNIEILDSIARSLQEEHNISVGIPEPLNDKSNDLNNNLFVEVNSFEEIYAELNNTKKEVGKQKGTNKNVNQVKSKQAPIAEIRDQERIPKNNIVKQQITVSNFEIVPPVKLIISENKQNPLNGLLDNIPTAEDSTEINVPRITEEETNTNQNLVNDRTTDSSSNSLDESDSEDSEESDDSPNSSNILISNANEVLAENIGNIFTPVNSIDINTENFMEQSTIQRNIETAIALEQNAQPENIIEQHVAITKQENIAGESNVILNVTKRNIEEDTNEHNMRTEVGTEQNMAQNIAIEQNVERTADQNTEPPNIVEHNTSTQLDSVQIVSDIKIAQENNENIQESEASNTTENSHNNSEAISINDQKKSPSKSPPKSTFDSTLNKAAVANKSNIPKLVKGVQNNKQKGDKTSPKPAGSKVPVRRTSIKQYPAPTPPKAHFGNVQSGHVKQLQTRLFNNKFPKTVVNVPDVVDVKPSTSTIHKKKQAPQPPTQQKGPSPSKASPPKEKKGSFFRESCRTEDEWTESEAEDAPPRPPAASEEPVRAPSPPPPVTLRRVSGQVVDLCRVRLPEGSPERQARMLLAEGATETWEQARLAVELVSRGAEAAAALLAALECADLPAALAYLRQDCELCAERHPEHEMVSMLRCTHRCCRECARLYFTVQVTERSIADCVCPFCKEPDLETTPEDAWLEYFAHLDIQLKTLLEPDVHELFQRKLRDRTLAMDPNFRWCMECSSGFFVHPKQKKIRCPECRSVSCAKCRKAWSVNHEGLSCAQYAAWLEDNDPERSLAAVQQHLRENGLECPRCHFKYSLSRGGCMHFTCTQCKYEFCYGCGKPFMMGARCGLSEYCARLGLHAHHPRNCLFYLRDKEPHDLQTLLQMNNVSYETEAPEGTHNRCPVQLQRETPAGLVDGICGGDTPPNHAGLCKNHYLEYLSRLVRARGVDPLPLLDVDDLETLVRRAALRPPPRPYGTLDGLYKRGLLAIVKEKIPLD